MACTRACLGKSYIPWVATVHRSGFGAHGTVLST